MTVHSNPLESGTIPTDHQPLAPSHGAWTIAVIIPTVGRAPTIRRTVERLAQQSRRPDRVIVVGVSEADVKGVAGASPELEVHFAPAGSCSQRNHAIDLIEGQADLVVFFDDDFVPTKDYLASAEHLFRTNLEIAGAYGRVIADGARGQGITFDDALSLVEAYRPAPDQGASLAPRQGGLYGCNMVFRAEAIDGLRFDENLPLYGWQEDIDFSFRAGLHGRLVRCSDFWGVHMGEKAGRSSGRRFGYSQIANPLYLKNKGSMPFDRAFRLMRDNFVSNLVRSFFPEPYIDRRGRLLGNIIALIDLFRRRLNPRRILEL